MKTVAAALAACLIASPALADPDYGQCISMLNAMISNQDQLNTALKAQAKAFFTTSATKPFNDAHTANLATQDQSNAAMKPYIDALAVACESIRPKS